MEPLEPTDVLSYINERIELDERLSDLWVVGEVSDYTRSQQGHRYFSLKDGYSSLRSVMFRTEMPGVDLEPGDSVIAHGRMAVYRQRGDLQFICDFARSAGMGLAAAKFEELRDRLEKDGLFDPARKRRVPAFARRIGVVTSPTGAAIQDIRQVVGRRWPLAELVLAPTMVQGEAAGVRIAAAIEELATEKGLDVAILARGGGGAEDLAGFNDERVARAIFRFPVPMVTGIGHETDRTIADYVADVYAPTPSAAAEACTPDGPALAHQLRTWNARAASRLRERLADRATYVLQASRHLNRQAPEPGVLAEDVRRIAASMSQAMNVRASSRQAAVEATALRFAVLDPMATLARGFAIVEDAGSRKVVNSTKQVKPGKRIAVSISDGSFWAEVS
ncbi:MAG: exodeoxyribonuclease VII large subunit [Dehalococcoidia bacterium]|nr:exodeoxyribonuclease VII large subunit [Dehalococcoidia bacterium]MCA9826196.1 exodeoxyribonuclease VII large subunit [Dehalococcoidia bacterium]